MKDSMIIFIKFTLKNIEKIFIPSETGRSCVSFVESYAFARLWRGGQNRMHT